MHTPVLKLKQARLPILLRTAMGANRTIQMSRVPGACSASHRIHGSEEQHII
jgi:hypothetical protein